MNYCSKIKIVFTVISIISLILFLLNDFNEDLFTTRLIMIKYDIYILCLIGIMGFYNKKIFCFELSSLFIHLIAILYLFSYILYYVWGIG